MLIFLLLTIAPILKWGFIIAVIVCAIFLVLAIKLKKTGFIRVIIIAALAAVVCFFLMHAKGFGLGGGNGSGFGTTAATTSDASKDTASSVRKSTASDILSNDSTSEGTEAQKNIDIEISTTTISINGEKCRDLNDFSEELDDLYSDEATVKVIDELADTETYQAVIDALNDRNIEFDTEQRGN